VEAIQSHIDPYDFARDSLLAYTIATMPGFRVGRHHRLIASALERVERGACRRLMIWAPPRHTKSELASVRFPAWYLGRNPGKFVISMSYGQSLADTFGRAVRNLIRDPVHRATFPGCSLRGDSKAASRFHTERGGVYHALGFDGSVTGKGAHALIIDDPVKNADDASSESYREKQKVTFARDLKTRLQPDAAIVVVQTRWHEDDLSGWLLRESSDPWEVICLPALAEETNALGQPDPLGRAPGEALWPEWYSVRALEEIRDQPGMGSGWWALYQQRPRPETGGLLQKAWWKRWRRTPCPPEMAGAWVELPKRDAFDEITLSWDMAFKGTAKSDFVVGQAWGRIGRARFFLLDQVRGRWDFPETVRQCEAFAKRWSTAREVLIEDKANGPAVIQSLSTKIPRLIAIAPEGGKVARVHAIAPLVQAGNVFIPDDVEATWAPGFVAEASDFPSGVNDDQVDTMSQALNRLNTRVGDGEVLVGYGDR
jgi:predicted phage terminase large subunit-like protein